MTKFRKKTLNEIADMICGNFDLDKSYFKYRSSSYLTDFFTDCEMDGRVHDGSTRKWWVVDQLEEILNQPSDRSSLPGLGFQTVIQVLMDRSDHVNEGPDRMNALQQLNISLARENLEAFYADDNLCYIRSTKTGAQARSEPLVHRALSSEELRRRTRLESFVASASEDELTEKVLVPLFQALAFQRISVAGHKDKALEYGKDVWMKHRLPTGHWLYFGLQVKRGKIDAAARSNNENVAEIHRQITMMLNNPIFDPDINKKRLIDHAFIISGDEITKQAKNWLAEKLDASQRSQIIFMDRSDILHLFIVHNIPMPDEVIVENSSTDSEEPIPF